MANFPDHPDTLAPIRAGVGLKADHYRTVLETLPQVGFFEVHAENYMGDGGPPHRYLSAIREHYPLSVHGVGLSIGSARPLNKAHLSRLKGVVDRYRPILVSEHLAWSSHDAGFLSDLLPLPYTDATLASVVDHIHETQDVLGRRILLENPSTYLLFAESTWSETDFLREIVRRTGCGLLLDVNNVQVSSVNRRESAFDYLETFPLEHVGQIHLAGHTLESDGQGRPLLIDTHDRPVPKSVWRLFHEVIRRTGPLPTLIEWDAEVPDWSVLAAEACRADTLMRVIAPEVDLALAG